MSATTKPDSEFAASFSALEQLQAKQIQALETERDRYREALEAIEGMSGAGGAGQISAMPIAARARRALA